VPAAGKQAASGAVAVRGALAAVPAPAGAAPTDSSMPGMSKKAIVRGILPRLAAATQELDTQQASAPPQRSTSRESAPDRPPPLRWGPSTAGKCRRGRAAASALRGSRPEVRE
jgi:hypothetical protein